MTVHDHGELSRLKEAKRYPEPLLILDFKGAESKDF